MKNLKSAVSLLTVSALGTVFGVSLSLLDVFGPLRLRTLRFFTSLGIEGLVGTDPTVLLRIVLPTLASLGIFLVAHFLNIKFNFIRPSIFMVFAASLAVGSFLLLVLPSTSDLAEAEVQEVPLVDSKLARVSGQINVLHIFFEALPASLSSGNQPFDLLSHGVEGWQEGAGLAQLPGHQFTIAGIASSLCGSKFPLEGFNDGSSPNFLMGSQLCVMDNLREAGYSSTFMQAASGYFQGKREFFAEHQTRMLDGELWEQLGVLEKTSWGYSINDEQLLERAKSVIRGLEADEDPYFLSLLTLDTHYPYYVPSGCNAAVPNNSADSYRCTMESVRDLLRWMQLRGFSDNTLILMQGDHLPTAGVAATDLIYFGYKAPNACPTAMDDLEQPANTAGIKSFTLQALAACDAELSLNPSLD